MLPNPDSSFLTDQQWGAILQFAQTHKEFDKLPASVSSKTAEWQEYAKDPDASGEGEPFYVRRPPKPYENTSPFNRLLLIKILRPEYLVRSIGIYLSQEMSPAYETPAPYVLDEVCSSASPSTPILFILSTGADPTSVILRFAAEKTMDKHLLPISLGQGQGQRAENLIERAKRGGEWVLLQNCHLAQSWLPTLEKLLDALANDDSVSPNFRLFLTSMPVSYFPTSILQNSIKLTTEQPRGVKANLKRCYASITLDELTSSTRPNEFKRLLFSLTFFHAVIQERKKFSPLGFNIPYEFNDSDLEVSRSTLRSFLDYAPSSDIPFDALLFVTGEIHYGGRITDEWDRVCLNAIIRRFYCPDAVELDGYLLSRSGTYFIPYFTPEEASPTISEKASPSRRAKRAMTRAMSMIEVPGTEANDLEVTQNYIDTLPGTDEPEIFGLHENAYVSYLKKETDRFLETILGLQPRQRTAGPATKEGAPVSVEDTVLRMIDEIESNVPSSFPAENIQKMLEANTGPNFADLGVLNVVLAQELDRYNILLDTIRTSLDSLRKAIRGHILMSSELDNMFFCLSHNIIPANWKKRSYATLKPLASWFKDLNERIIFMLGWLDREQPKSFWLSAFYFPQGFLTGVLQSYARRNKKEIDKLRFKYKVTSFTSDKLLSGPKDGVYIHGLYLTCARWDENSESLADQQPKVLYNEMPVINFIPVENHKPNENEYICPLYKTSNRVGVLSTTGQSTNYIPVSYTHLTLPTIYSV
eukprot:TRINITY_DN1514_c0_g2_i1.p1 TRINITY_DN1514_c0_g2~~TRINITY_DN1514_c0_g2_i1.p1  ORF type:complete len:757 (+),score=146.41 TRINITY_DN1514_c0_g2_i1:194-2464(+)